MLHLSIDIETRSSVDISKAGAYKYAQSEDFEILLFAYKEDDEEVRVIDLANGEELPGEIVSALSDPTVTKHAWNAAFEWWCLNQAGYQTPIAQWKCTMINSLYHGFPASLDAAGEALGLSDDQKKMSAGKALIRHFCVPCKPTKANGGRMWNLPQHDPDRWALFKEYNAQDVLTEYTILQELNRYSPMPEKEQRLWWEDILMNARGIAVDPELIEGALTIDEISTEKLMERAREVTGLENPKSTAQLLNWLREKTGENIPNIQKATVAEMISSGKYPDEVVEALQLRQQLGKTSVSKYKAMAEAKGPDDRIRGVLQFYGANRSGRWAGRLVQVQNLARNHLSSLDEARELVKQKDYESLQMIYGNVPDTLSQLIRTAFIPSEGNKFIVCDFSAIEARVIAWLAGEKWVNEVFATTGKIYEATAGRMFGVDPALIVKGRPEYELRQKGKVATLALGYQGGIGALKTMGALEMGIPEEELQPLVDMWRRSNPHIVRLWWDMEKAAKATILSGKTYKPNKWLTFSMERGRLSVFTILLPSGRKLFYVNPRVDDVGHIYYYGLNQTTRKWQEEETYGGKLTENVVQAIARDCLAETLLSVNRERYRPVMHIHDEIVIDAKPGESLEDVNEIFSDPIPWAPGLVLKGVGFESNYYMKD
jgi:DNA polymerase